MDCGKKMSIIFSLLKKIAFYLVFFSIFFVFSCKKSNGQIEMQPLLPEELSPRIEWALITDPYVACHKEALYESEVIASFRKGEIYEIKGNCTVLVDETKEKWYALSDGWVPSSAIKVYSNKLKAENARKKLK